MNVSHASLPIHYLIKLCAILVCLFCTILILHSLDELHSWSLTQQIKKSLQQWQKVGYIDDTNLQVSALQLKVDTLIGKQPSDSTYLTLAADFQKWRAYQNRLTISASAKHYKKANHLYLNALTHAPSNSLLWAKFAFTIPHLSTNNSLSTNTGGAPITSVLEESTSVLSTHVESDDTLLTTVKLTSAIEQSATLGAWELATQTELSRNGIAYWGVLNKQGHEIIKGNVIRALLSNTTHQDYPIDDMIIEMAMTYDWTPHLLTLLQTDRQKKVVDKLLGVQ